MRRLRTLRLLFRTTVLLWVPFAIATLAYSQPRTRWDPAPTHVFAYMLWFLIIGLAFLPQLCPYCRGPYTEMKKGSTRLFSNACASCKRDV